MKLHHSRPGHKQLYACDCTCAHNSVALALHGKCMCAIGSAGHLRDVVLVIWALLTVRPVCGPFVVLRQDCEVVQI